MHWVWIHYSYAWIISSYYSLWQYESPLWCAYTSKSLISSLTSDILKHTCVQFLVTVKNTALLPRPDIKGHQYTSLLVGDPNMLDFCTRSVNEASEGNEWAAIDSRILMPDDHLAVKPGTMLFFHHQQSVVLHSPPDLYLRPTVENCLQGSGLGGERGWVTNLILLPHAVNPFFHLHGVDWVLTFVQTGI